MIRLCSLFSDHAVLQQGMQVPVWGTAPDGKNITVEFCGQSVSTTALEGRWLVTLDPMVAGGPYVLRICGGNDSLVSEDILVGDVWLCAGQSNMARRLIPIKTVQPRHEHGEQEAKTADLPTIRHFQVEQEAADEPCKQVHGSWQVCSPETVKNFSAVGFFFAGEMWVARGVPTGLINASVGSTAASAWVSKETLETTPGLHPILQRQQEAQAAYPKQLKEFESASVGQESEEAPAPPRDPATDDWRPTGFYNRIVAPLAPVAMRAVLWYQGESDNGRPEEYRILFPALISSWRALWKRPELPFLFVQLPNHKNITPEIREVQRLTGLETKHTGMVVTVDCGDDEDIHPPDKQPFGARLALLARALVCGEDIIYSVPVLSKIAAEPGRATLHFQHVGTGLMAKNGSLKGFETAGADGEFLSAVAEIDDDRVVVLHPANQQPVALRYGWHTLPEVSLYNREGLPASPFRASLTN